MFCEQDTLHQTVYHQVSMQGDLFSDMADYEMTKSMLTIISKAFDWWRMSWSPLAWAPTLLCIGDITDAQVLMGTKNDTMGTTFCVMVLISTNINSAERIR